jgi:uncharacterized damage-inducible protein DinB
MSYKVICEYFLNEMKTESLSARKCLERIPEDLYEYKPHEKSMKMGYLALLVADIPRWVNMAINDSTIDFANYDQFPLSTNKALLDHYDKNIQDAIDALTGVTEDQLSTPFELKNEKEILFTQPKLENIGSSINHWVHHRGQLTVYMRLNNIDVPSIYGPSGDEKTW